MIRYQLPEGMMGGGFVCLSSQLQYNAWVCYHLVAWLFCLRLLPALRNYDTDRPRGSEIFPADFQICDPSGKEKRKLCPIATTVASLLFRGLASLKASHKKYRNNHKESFIRHLVVFARSNQGIIRGIQNNVRIRLKSKK